MIEQHNTDCMTMIEGFANALGNWPHTVDIYIYIYGKLEVINRQAETKPSTEADPHSWSQNGKTWQCEQCMTRAACKDNLKRQCKAVPERIRKAVLSRRGHSLLYAATYYNNTTLVLVQSVWSLCIHQPKIPPHGLLRKTN